MKILTGKLKGHPIKLSPGPGLRPTSDLARKAIFDTLQGAIEGKSVLDIFGGTGALGFEALSSGAVSAVWIESDRAQARAIEATVSSLKLRQKTRVVTADALTAIRDLADDGESFDLIFLDPPYRSGLGVAAMGLIEGLKLYRPGAIIVLETHKTEDPPPQFGSLEAVKTKKHGDTKITFYRES